LEVYNTVLNKIDFNSFRIFKMDLARCGRIINF